jgi:sialate O-acetylesterase
VTEWFSAVCFLTAVELLKQPLYANRTIGLVFSAVGGTPIHDWSPPAALQACNVSAAPRQASSSSMTPSVASAAVSADVGVGPFPEGDSTLWNAMIAPLAGYALRGVMWYQGEADSGQPAGYYSCLFAAMIAAWRDAWGTGDFAWTFVQLAPQYNPAALPDYSLARVRLEQASVLPCAGCATDTTGEW